MRVLIVIDSLDASGGAERSLAALASPLRALEIDLHVGYLRERTHSVASVLQEADVVLHAIDGRGGRVGSAMRCSRLTRMLRPDLVHTTLFEADQAGRVGARLARCPVVSSLVNVAYGPEQMTTPGVARWKFTAARALDASTAQLATRFHAITGHVADVMAQRLHVPRERIDVVPRGRDAASLGRRSPDRRSRARRDLGLADDQQLVLAIGREEWQKGHDVLVGAVPDVVRRWPKVVFAIAGRNGAESGRLEEAIRRERLGDHVRVLGFREDTPELLCAADVFAFPSRWEGLGSTIIEAMALEAPIASADLPAVREVVTQNEALFFPPGDPAALAAAIDTCLRESDAATTRARAARRRFLEEFTIDRSAAQIVNFYERALAGRR